VSRDRYDIDYLIERKLTDFKRSLSNAAAVGGVKGGSIVGLNFSPCDPGLVLALKSQVVEDLRGLLRQTPEKRNGLGTLGESRFNSRTRLESELINLQFGAMLETALRIGSRKQCMSVPATKIHSRIRPQPMPRTARRRGFCQLIAVTAVVVATSQKASAITSTDRPRLIRSTQR
jgi:hypothetical protein